MENVCALMTVMFRVSHFNGIRHDCAAMKQTQCLVSTKRAKIGMNWPRQYLLSFTFGIAMLVSTGMVLADETTCLRAQDELWIVSTRGVCTCRCPESDDFAVRQFAEGKWSEASLDELLVASEAVTAVLVHGNRINSSWAKRHGWMIYRKLSCGARDDEPIRFVIWSWPSERINGPIRDARSKAQRATSEGLLFGWFLGHFSEENRLSLIGYSYGARIVGGGLHVAGGGSLNGRELEDPMPARSVHVSLLAAAVHRDGLSTSGQFGKAKDQMGEFLLFINQSDPTLRRYYWLDKRNPQNALGFSGYCQHQLDPLVHQVDISPYIGRSHDIQRYFASRQIVSMVRDNVLWRSDAPAKDACR